MTKLFLSVAMIPALLIVGGCGKSPTPDGSDDNLSSATDTAMPSQAKGTVETASIDCTNRNAAPGTKNDVLGITLGMGAQEAFERLACANKAFKVEFSDRGGFRLPDVPGQARPRTLITADAGTEKASVYLIGLPGEEKVYAISRDVEFGEGSEPPLKPLFQSLVAKYGEPVQHAIYGDAIFSVVLSPSGARLGPQSEDFSTCASNSPKMGRISAESRCGFTVDFELIAKTENAGLAKRLFLSLIDQRAAQEAVERYQQMASGAVERQKADELQRANEAVGKAGEDSGRMPNL